MKGSIRVLSVFLAVLMICTAAFTAFAEPAGEKKPAAETEISKVAAKKITISGSKYVAKGKKVTLKAAVFPAKASQKVVWTSSDEKIAKVSSKGVVKGIKAGKVKITATSKANPKIKATWKMTVTPKPVKKIAIKAPVKNLDLNGTKTVTLKAKVSPSNAAGEVVWKSSKPSVASVSKKGKVTAKSKGSTVITASAVDGSGVKTKITITVIDSSEPVEPENPNPHEVYVTAHKGNKFTFFMYFPELKDSYRVNDPDNTKYTVEFRLGFVVQDGNKGYTVETAYSNDGGQTKEITISQMDHGLFFVNQEEQSFDPLGKAEFSVKGKNLTWTVTFPDGFNPAGARLKGAFVYYFMWNITDSASWEYDKPLL